MAPPLERGRLEFDLCSVSAVCLLPPPSLQSASSALVRTMASPAVWWQTVRLHHVSTPCTSLGNAAPNARTVGGKITGGGTKTQENKKVY